MKKKQYSIRDFPELVTALWNLGINTDDLGCVMLDVIPPKELSEVKKTIPMSAFAYDTTKFWVKGWVADHNPHITLRYGLLEKASYMKDLIEQALEGWTIQEAEIKSVGTFDTPDDVPYYPVVAHIETNENLIEGHERLGFLPNVSTFTKYKIHMTIAYIKKSAGEEFKNGLLKDLNDKVKGKKLEIKAGLNLGD